MIADFMPKRDTNVLIIDDDVDSALLVASIFWQFGCSTAFALDEHEARNRLIDGKADIIILDWILSEHARADKVLKRSIEVIDKYSTLKSRHCQHRAKIVSYSTLDDSAIQLPRCEYFQHLDHWRKPMLRSDLMRRAQHLLDQVRR